MIEVSLSCPPLSSLRSRFRDAPRVVSEELTRGLREAGPVLRESIRAVTPVRTGRLRASVNTRLTGSGQLIELRAFSVVPYARWVEQGTSRFRGRFMFRRGTAAAQGRLRRILGNAQRRVLYRLARGR